MKSLLPAIALLTVSSASGQTILNGSFESTALQADTWASAFSGGIDQGVVGGWAFSATAVPSTMVVLVNGAPVQSVPPIVPIWAGLSPLDGEQFLAFNAGNMEPNGLMSQTFNTVPGTPYAVTYSAGRGGSGPFTLGGTVGLRAEVISATASILGSAEDFPASIGWLPARRISFVATTTETTLRFIDISTATESVDVTLDNVTVAVIPEPAQYTTALAVTLLGFSASRKWLR